MFDGSRLRALRKKMGLTAKQFGDKFGLAESTISGYETGARTPDAEKISKFADFFGVSTDYLHGRTDDPQTNKKTDHEDMVGDDYIMEQKRKTIELIKQAPEEDIRIIYEVIKKITQANSKSD